MVLDTWLVDSESSDLAAEIQALWQRQRLVDAVAHGEVPFEDLLDCLSTQGHSADEYLEVTDENLTMFFEINPEARLYLPC